MQSDSKEIILKTTKKKVAKKATKKVVTKKSKNAIAIDGKSEIAKLLTGKIDLTPEQKASQKLHSKFIKFCEKNEISVVGAISMNKLGCFSVQDVNCKSQLEKMGLVHLLKESI